MVWGLGSGFAGRAATFGGGSWEPMRAAGSIRVLGIRELCAFEISKATRIDIKLRVAIPSRSNKGFRRCVQQFYRSTGRVDGSLAFRSRDKMLHYLRVVPGVCFV